MIKNNIKEWCALPTEQGEFRMYDTGDELVRLVSYGDIWDISQVPLVRIHSSCIASEIFGAKDCDCADQIKQSMAMMASEGSGMILHLHQEGRGHGLSTKIEAVSLMQCQTLDTFEAFEALGIEQDPREYKDATDILKVLGINQVRLITNNPRKIQFVENEGIIVHERIMTNPEIRHENRDYLFSKNKKLEHQLPLEHCGAV